MSKVMVKRSSAAGVVRTNYYLCSNPDHRNSVKHSFLREDRAVGSVSTFESHEEAIQALLDDAYYYISRGAIQADKDDGRLVFVEL